MCNVKLENKNIGSIFVSYEFGRFIEFTDNYFYKKELQEGVDGILFPNEFDGKETIEAIKYFKQFQNSAIIIKLVERYIKDFKDKNKADELLKQEAIRCFNGIVEKDFEKYNIDLGRFADVYIRRKVREDIMNAYAKIKSYSDFIFQNI